MRNISGVLLWLSLMAGPVSLHAEAVWLDPARADAEPMPLASSSLLLDAVVVEGQRVLAVGERGHIVYSDDHGQSWQQASVPTRSTLTTVAANGRTVLAAGHDGVIVRSEDAGVSWQRVREDIFEPGSFDPTSGAPILDLLFLDDMRVLAIGAYSLLLASNDAGASWDPLDVLARHDDAGDDANDSTSDDADTGFGDPLLFDEADLVLDQEEDPHLNAITRLPGGRLFIVAERGAAFVSDDDGEHWRRQSLPYDGSMFGILALDDERLLAFGLRGNMQVSSDRGDNWQELDSGSDLSLFGAAARGDGAVLVGANGLVLQVDRTLSKVRAQPLAESGVLSAAIETADGSLLVVGENGARRIPVAAGDRP